MFDKILHRWRRDLSSEPRLSKTPQASVLAAVSTDMPRAVNADKPTPLPSEGRGQWLRTDDSKRRHDGLSPHAKKQEAPLLPSLGLGDGTSLEVANLAAQQQALLDNPPIDTLYSQALAVYLQGKHEQVDRLEDQLRRQKEASQRELNGLQKPWRLYSRGKHRSWEKTQAQCKRRIADLSRRLDRVVSLREATGLHSPRLEELAVRKLRWHQNDLAGQWDEQQQTARRQRLELVRSESSRRQGHRVSLSASQRLSLEQ